MDRFADVWQSIVDAFKMVIDTILGIFGINKGDGEGEGNND